VRVQLADAHHTEVCGAWRAGPHTSICFGDLNSSAICEKSWAGWVVSAGFQ
jgi:hypothetical protein